MMYFDSPENRVEFFKRSLGGNIIMGSALDHVASTNLGVWGSEADLRWDAARMMAEEVCAFAHGNKIRWPYHATAESRDKLAREIDRNGDFLSAFSAARRGNIALIGNTMRSLGHNASHMDEMNGSVSNDELEAAEGIHATLYTEIIGPIRRGHRH